MCEYFTTKNYNQCQDSDAIYAFTQFIREEKKKIMILGPGCSKSAEPLAKVCPYYNLVQVSLRHSLQKV